VVDKTDKGKEDGLAGRGLDDRRFSSASGVEVNVGAFFGCLCSDIKVKDFDNVTDKVR